MRWAVLITFAGFCAAGAEVTSDLLVRVGVLEGCKMESERLRAAGSMSGMVSEGEFASMMRGASTILPLSQLHLESQCPRGMEVWLWVMQILFKIIYLSELLVWFGQSLIPHKVWAVIAVLAGGAALS